MSRTIHLSGPKIDRALCGATFDSLGLTTGPRGIADCPACLATQERAAPKAHEATS